MVFSLNDRKYSTVTKKVRKYAKLMLNMLDPPYRVSSKNVKGMASIKLSNKNKQ